MPATEVPATTACKRNRVANIDTDRLTRRRDHLAPELLHNSRQFDHRIEFVARVAELVAIETELIGRGALDAAARVTRPG